MKQLTSPLNPRERGCLACFHHQKSVWRSGMIYHATTVCQSDPQNRQTNPIYGVLVTQAGGSPPAVAQKFAHFYPHTPYNGAEGTGAKP
ncbi:MAG: hypothetical protein SH821_13370 [Phototrophicales bacterium]|nr:hypothetical protein [Phototrophicales bacterium]